MSIHDILLPCLYFFEGVIDQTELAGQDNNFFQPRALRYLTPASPPLLLSQCLRCFIRSVMKGSEPFVPGHIVCSVVAIKKPVMQLMKKVPQLYNSLTPHEKRLIATVCDDRRQHRELKMINHVQRAGGNDDMDQR